MFSLKKNRGDIVFSFKVVDEKFAIISVEERSRITGKIPAEFKKWFESKKLDTYKAVILDGRNIEFVDSMGIASFISLYKILSQKNIPFAVCGLNSEVRNLFKLLKLDKIFVMDCNSPEDFIKNLGDDSHD
ncbi:MAG: anti-sigma factor antagonist [Kosmotoga sp.]|jgi:anti-sigma B factor antagonist|nr:anti-sigma factor antagonist [Kosmotoga sp.]MDK2953815.1 anti-sigma factor antagonist [Kosmotoga sp.]